MTTTRYIVRPYHGKFAVFAQGQAFPVMLGIETRTEAAGWRDHFIEQARRDAQAAEARR